VTHRNRFIVGTWWPYLGLAWVIAASCAIFPAQTFNEKYAAGVQSCTSALILTDQLLTAGKISGRDAKNVEKQVDNVKEALDLAYQAHTMDGTLGSDKLTAALTALQAISLYLTQQQGKK